MKKICRTTVYGLIGAALLLPETTGLAADVCTQGVGIPPFLSSGARPNLLMVLDNSGSMLDAAYSKSGTLYQVDSDGNTVVDGDGNPVPLETSGGTELTYQRCLDGDYDISEYDNKGNETVLATVYGYEGGKTYGGYFQSDKWYQWTPKTGNYAYSPWQSGQTYEAGDRVFDYGNIYEAATGGTSTGESIDKDTEITWNHVLYLPRWTNNTAYSAGSFVWYENQLYYTEAGGTSNDPSDTDGLKLSDDTGITDWKAVDSTWQAKSYAENDIVTYQGVYYQALSDISSTDAKPSEDNGAKWQSLRQGAFEEIDPADACSGAAGTKYEKTDALCLTIDETETPKKVTSFAARGNFLNWAMASKFDVEKKILTGGKFNYYEKVMVGEHRGCSGSRFLKQVKLDSGKFLSLGVRGSKYSANDPFMWDRIDTADDTARLEILAVTDAGFKPSAECQEMIETVTTQENNGANWKSAIEACLGTFPDTNTELADLNPILNHGLQFCSKLNDDSIRDVTTITAECQNLYEGKGVSRKYDPTELEPESGAYLCFGIYDSSVSASERAGYVGRCWKPATGVFATCERKPASLENLCSDYPCTYEKTEGSPAKTKLYLNEIPEGGTVAYVYKCEQVAPNTSKDDGFGCTKVDGDKPGSRGNWTPQYMWKKTNGDYEGTCEGPNDIPPGAIPADWENAADDNAVEECIIQASIDYCNDTSIPEVIDPSDQAGDTTKTWNIPGVLTDSQILAQLGGTHPMATLKGYISEQDRPEGIMQSVASDLRLGLMSFNDVGAATECSSAYLTGGIERFCPVENKDGATLLSEIEDGDWVIAADSTFKSGKRRHVDELAQEINDIRATSWTPLGEAFYSALGYYTQNSKFCLNVDSDGNCLDWCLDVDDDPDSEYYDTDPDKCAYPADDDPVQYWCQDNHILVITEGESTADVNSTVAGFAANPSDYFVTKTADDDVAGDADGDPNLTADLNADGTDESCQDSLYTSTYLDDMTWWGHRALPLYKKRYLYDPDGNENEKNPISSYLVTTGTLTGSTTKTGECNPDTLMTNAAVNGGTERYYSGEDPQELEDNLYAVLGDIMNRASAGAAASVISNSRSGDGAIYQALFWPMKNNGIFDDKGNEGTVRWIGDVHALFIDSNNIIYEDTNQDGKLVPTEDIDGDGNLDIDEDVNNNDALDPGEDIDGDGKLDTDEDTNGNGSLDTGDDKRINTYFSNTVNRARGCYVDLDADYQCPTDPVDDCDGSVCVELEDIKYLWSANEQLRKMDVLNDRRIFTWNDFDNDGIVDDDEDSSLNTTGETFLLKSDGMMDWSNLVSAGDLGTAGRGPVVNDFLTPDDYGNFVGLDSSQTQDERANDAMDALVKWLLGKDVLDDEVTDSAADDNDWIDRSLRSRHYNFVTKNNDGTTTEIQEEWRLGDVIYSSPITVNKPAENFDLIYRDPSYNKFAKRWKNRRTVVYFGANDGMLHAVNSGFYKDADRQFYCSEGYTGEADHGDCGDGEYNLGEELWAYVPYNLQPHLKCLADKFYDHKYFVDLEPRIADVQIFTPESTCPLSGDYNSEIPDSCIHPFGWGTILVGGMRFGGAPVAAEELNGLDGSGDDNIHDLREFSSSYFFLDITNPEKPRVVGELTRTTDNTCVEGTTCVDLNYTTVSPGIIVMRQDDGKSSDWYLVMGNGPAEQDGTNTVGTQGKIAVLPLKWLTTGKKIRIPDQLPTATFDAGVFNVPFPNEDSNSGSYISHIISMDYNIELTSDDGLGARYRTDAAYFGTVDGTDFAKYSDDAVKAMYPNADSNLGDQWYWNGGGRVYRLVTRITDMNDQEIASKPYQWTTPDGLVDDANSKGPIRMLMDVKSPVTASLSAGYDEGGRSFWIYAGTGRFYDEKDKTDDGMCLNDDCTSRTQRAFFGLKEPIKDGRDFLEPSDVCSDAVMTWETIDWDIADWGTATDGKTEANVETGIKALVPGGKPGERGLMRTDNILTRADYGDLLCVHYKTNPDGNYDDVWNSSWSATNELVCFPGGKEGPIYNKVLEGYTIENLQEYITGTGCQSADDNREYVTGLDGWYHVFHDPRERNLSSPLLLGQRIFFATYQPYNDKCKAEGQSFFYLLDHVAGTGAWDHEVIMPSSSDEGSTGEKQYDPSRSYTNTKSGKGRNDSGGGGDLGGGGSEGDVLHDFKTQVRGLANISSGGGTGSGGEFYAKELDPVDRESNKLNWSDRCGVVNE